MQDPVKFTQEVNNLELSHSEQHFQLFKDFDMQLVPKTVIKRKKQPIFANLDKNQQQTLKEMNESISFYQENTYLIELFQQQMKQKQMQKNEQEKLQNDMMKIDGDYFIENNEISCFQKELNSLNKV
eukprot:TRINITY_DN36428_c0_g1_i1.p2 TRINITY_DN36428_c0_g1~~TRINITY_DN36428_c0_g1_i1.p2  ORF type:complete len:127 (+),score=29.65 TRINITY_DN36428_c0_g1_i1:177-557(+)